LFQTSTSGKVPCNDRVRCAKRTLPWASAGGEPARKCAPCPEPFPGICDRASAIRTPPCRPVRLSERTHRTWLEERRGRQGQRQSRKVRGAPYSTSHFTRRLAWLAQAALRFFGAADGRGSELTAETPRTPRKTEMPWRLGGNVASYGSDPCAVRVSSLLENLCGTILFAP